MLTLVSTYLDLPDCVDDAGVRQVERVLQQQMAGVRVRHVDPVVCRGGLLVRQHLPGDQERHGVYPARGGHSWGGQGLGGCDWVRGWLSV